METTTKQSYWLNSGKYQAEFNQLWNKLCKPYDFYNVPTIEGTLLSYANRLYYECFNNGNLNACNSIEEYKKVIHTIDLDYLEMMKFIHQHLPNSGDLLIQVGRKIVSSYKIYKGREEKKQYFEECYPIYDELMDRIIEYIK